MDYYVKNNDVIVNEKDFDLDETLDCGQAFRWKKTESDYKCTYTGKFLNSQLKISQAENGNFIFHDDVYKLFRPWRPSQLLHI